MSNNSLEDKNVFNMNNYFGKTFITLFNVIPIELLKPVPGFP